jgi:hypothetical protein
MSVYPHIERISSNDDYFVAMNGEPIQPANTDIVMDYWTAETVVEFLQAVNPNQVFSIKRAVFIEQPQQATLRVST